MQAYPAELLTNNRHLLDEYLEALGEGPTANNAQAVLESVHGIGYLVLLPS